MRALTTTLFPLFIFTSNIYAASNEIETYEELSTLGLLVIIFVVSTLFISTVAVLYLSMVYAFGDKFKLPTGPYAFQDKFKLGGGGWQLWLLIIFALAVIVSSLLLSPAVIIGVFIILAAVIAAILFTRRRRRP